MDNDPRGQIPPTQSSRREVPIPAEVLDDTESSRATRMSVATRRRPRISPGTKIRLGIVVIGFAIGIALRFTLPNDLFDDHLPDIESAAPAPLSDKTLQIETASGVDANNSNLQSD